jgi:biofilm PGA synthesis lipoprotein PgaB
MTSILNAFAKNTLGVVVNFFSVSRSRIFACVLFFVAVANAHAATVLIYHHVSNTMPATTSISPEHFIAHMDYLEKNNYKIVSLVELTEKLRKGDILPDRTIAITFDDSYADVYTAAYPILKKRGWPFTFFVNTDAVGSGKLFVTWDQLREMSKHGVTIANHTTKHNHLVRLSKDESLAQWRERIVNEITGAQTKIEQEIGSATKLFAYPFGEYNAELRGVLKKMSYVAFTQQAGVLNNTTDLQTLPRFPFGGSFTELTDFIEKINTLPMPVKQVEFYADKQHRLDDVIVKVGDKPFLVLTLGDTSLLKKIHCFSSNEGEISTEVVDEKLWIQSRQTFPAGRTKFNCTAASNERGQFYWYTQLWLVTDKNGSWTYQD